MVKLKDLLILVILSIEKPNSENISTYNQMYKYIIKLLFPNIKENIFLYLTQFHCCNKEKT